MCPAAVAEYEASCAFDEVDIHLGESLREISALGPGEAYTLSTSSPACVAAAVAAVQATGVSSFSLSGRASPSGSRMCPQFAAWPTDAMSCWGLELSFYASE